MTGIISSGIGSGLDVAGIVSQLVAAEGAPTESRIARGEAKTQSKLSAFGGLKSALSEFRDQLDKMTELKDFLTRKASSANEDLFSVSVDSDALPASYSVEVVNLAQAQRLTSGVFADQNTAVGTGTLTIDLGGDSFDVEIDTSNNTLDGIRDAINASTDNPGVAATIVNADTGSYLILTSEKTGAANTMTVTQAGGDGGLAALEYDPVNGLNSLSESQAASDSLIRIDGFDVTGETNSISGAIDGVTIDLFQAGTGTPAELLVENDGDEVKRTLTEFVDSYNALVETFTKLTSYDAETEAAGALLGDASLRGIQSMLRREMSNVFGESGATFSSLSDIGIELELDGKLKLDDTRIGEVLDTDFTAVGQLFAGTSGFATQVHDLVDGFLDDEGIITIRTEGYEKTLEDYKGQRERLQERLTVIEDRLFRQFNALDSLVSNLTSTSTFLTQQLANIPTPGNGS